MPQTIKVLVIEDEPAMQKVLKSFFTDFFAGAKRNFEIEMYADSMQGLFELNNHGEQYHIIVLDIMLPKISGDEIFNSLLHTNPEITKRVLFSTATPDVVTERFDDLNLHVLQKPFSFPVFCEKVKGVLIAQQKK